MNLFYLDQDLDKCAEYHVDAHVGKMQLEAAQLLSTALWVDKLFGFIPRKLNGDELAELKIQKLLEPEIEKRSFTRYLPTHVNHPSNIWVRSSLDNFEWTHCYINALNSETIWRGNKPHASCAETNRLPEPRNLPSNGFTKFALAMPVQLQTEDAITSYRMFYMLDKWPFAKWKRRGKPEWWNDELVSQQTRRISEK